jgi:uncharacterized protein YjbI with pentapeptide repeats
MWRGLLGVAIAGAVLLVSALVAAALILPGRLAPPVPEAQLAQIAEPKERLEAADARLRLRHDLRNGMLQLLTVIAVLAGAGLGFQQLAEDRSNAAADRELTRQGQASQRFTQAIDQLGDSRVETRIGGIYGLGQIAEQAPDNNGPVGEVLLAYINRLARPEKPPTAPLNQYAPDVQAALTVLTRSDTNGDHIKDYAWLSHRLDLRGFGLQAANLGGAALAGADLLGADLTEALLQDADLSRARLGQDTVGGPLSATLTDADLRGATLDHAQLMDTDLQGAQLAGASLRGTKLMRATLGLQGLVPQHTAILLGADLTGAFLMDAKLERVDLREAKLGGAHLNGADLFGANLSGAHLDADLRGAELSFADLRGADLRGAQLDKATLYYAMVNDRTTWPAGFDWHSAGVRPS